MSDKVSVSVNIPLGDDGMMGRECLECEQYFKLKPGTGLPTSYCHCPYCEYEGNSDTFWTPAQLEYAKSVAINQAFEKYVKPTLDSIKKSFKELERDTRNSLIQFKVTTKNDNYSLPIKYYTEQELETKITCSNCELEFSIFGVFSRCPDCKELNAFLTFEKSLEVTSKQLEIFSKPEIPDEIRNQSLSFVLSSCISAFDGLGKELRKRNPSKYPTRPKNLFQNLYLLNEKLGGYFEKEHPRFNFLIRLFQVRHIYEHNMGVIDEDFISKLPAYNTQKGRKYKLSTNELKDFIEGMRELGELVKTHFEND